MGGEFYLILGLALCGFGFIVALAFTKDFSRFEWTFQIARVFMVVFVFSFVFLLTTPIYLEYGDISKKRNSETYVVKLNSCGGVVEKSINFLVCNNQCIKVIKKVRTLESEVKPVTENPKVRDIQYEIEYETYDEDRIAQFVFFESKKEDVDIEFPVSNTAVYRMILKKVQYLTYEFNNDKSKEMANFYNPLDKEQANAFLELAKEYFNPTLDEIGVRIVGIEWNVK